MRALVVLLLPFLFVSLFALPGVTLTVVDENRVPVPATLLTFENAQTGEVVKGETDSLGRFVLSSALNAEFKIRAEKKGFYPAVLRSFPSRWK